MATRLYVGNLPVDVCEADIRELFESVGTVVDCNLIVDESTNESRGFAFVEMASKDDAMKAIAEYNGKDFKGRPVVVAGRLYKVLQDHHCYMTRVSEPVARPADIGPRPGYFVREFLFVTPSEVTCFDPDYAHLGGGQAVRWTHPIVGGWAELVYEWGCQPASHFVNAVGSEEAKGCGDNAPYLTAGGEIRYPADDRAEFDSACEELDSRLEREHGAWIRESYARRQNPLPGLRKRVGGTWEFFRPDARWQRAESPCGEIEIPGVGRVRWTPAG